VQARFDEAMQLAEQAFLDELTKLVEHFGERLSGTSSRMRSARQWHLGSSPWTLNLKSHRNHAASESDSPPRSAMRFLGTKGRMTSSFG
jgi:hypothetical protein